MANIIKASSGLLFSEEFGADLSLVWTVSPNFPDRVVKNSDSISLLPGAERMELLIPAPDGDAYVLQSEMDFAPTVATDTGGITLRSVTDSTIDFEIQGDDTKVMKFAKTIIDNYNVLTAIGSLDGKIWQEYGNTKVTNMNKTGFFIGEKTTSDQIEIKSCYMYRNNNVIFNNFDRRNIIKIYDAAGVEITSQFVFKRKNTQVQLDGTEVLFPLSSIIVRVFDRDTGALLHEGTLTDVYGGDIYEYNYNVEFYINDNLLTNAMYDLGTISESKIFELKVSNKEAYDIVDRTLSVNYFTYMNPGYQSVDIAPENSATFTKFIEHVSLTAGETKTFQLKVADYKKFLNLEEQYKFKINFE